MAKRYFEDIAVGDTFGGDSYTVSDDDVFTFAQKWDPRPIHLDHEAGRAAGFGGAIASGAMTTAILTRLIHESRSREGAQAVIAGLGSEHRLPHPVRAGDTIRYDAEVIEKRPSARRLDAGVVKTRTRLTNQNAELVYDGTTVTLMARREPARNEDG